MPGTRPWCRWPRAWSGPWRVWWTWRSSSPLSHRTRRRATRHPRERPTFFADPDTSAPFLPLPVLDLGGDDRGLDTALHAELGEQAGDVVLHRLLGEVQPLADLAVGEALADQGEDLPLPGGQALQPVRLFLLLLTAPQSGHQLGGGARIQQ